MAQCRVALLGKDGAISCGARLALAHLWGSGAQRINQAVHSMHYQQVTFFRPAEVERERTSIPAGLYNRCRLLLRRSPPDCVFVPVRSMQFQAVITEEEIIFVDSQGYAVQDGHGGRLILLAWAMRAAERPRSLVEPVPIDLVFYRRDLRDTQRRLMSELPNALDRAEEKLRESVCEPSRLKVLPFRADSMPFR